MSVPRRILSIVFAHFGWKVLALAIALVVWISVSSEPELSTFAAVPVEYKDIPDDLEISSDVIESIYLELRGPAGELRGTQESGRFAVVLDMTDVRPGERTFSIGDDNVNLPRGLHLVRSIPSQLRFQFEKTVSRDLPVRVRFSGKPPEGYELAGFDVFPQSIPVSGPESRVVRAKAAETDSIDLSSVVGPAEFRVNTFVNDAHVRFTGPAQVVVRVRVIRRTAGRRQDGPTRSRPRVEPNS